MLISATTWIALLFLGFVGLITVARVLRASRGKRPVDKSRRCVCGYSVEHLEVPRCPECGRLVGFKDTRPEDIGLSEEEMRAYAEKKRREREGGAR